MAFQYKNIFLALAIIGPGIISAIAGNDAGGIATFSVAGSHYGYAFFWVFIPLIIALIIVQELCARMGVVTGKGLADLIREHFGLKITVFLLLGLVIANFATTVSEFAGIAAAAELFGWNKVFVVVSTGLFILFLIIRVKYKALEKFFLFLCLFYVTYIISGVLSTSNWKKVGMSLITPTFVSEKEYWILLVGILGTSITPWMQFYLQSTIVQKGIKLKEYVYARWEVILSAIVAVTISFFILLAATETMYKNDIIVDSAEQAAVALEPFAGHFAAVLFAVGLFAAAFFGAFILPLSSAYYVCEALGWESGVNKTFHQAKEFYIVIGLLLIPSMITVLLLHKSLFFLMILAQVINGLLLPVILIVILQLVNNEKIMGEHVNSKWYNVLCWFVAGLLILVALIMVGMTLVEVV